MYFDNLKLFMESETIQNLSDEEKGYSSNVEANTLLFGSPLAFVFGLIFDQSIKSSVAWEAPFLLQQRLGHLDLNKIAKMRVGDLEAVLAGGSRSLHRYPKNMAKYLVGSCKIIMERFDSNVESIWKGETSYLKTKKRLMQLSGIGEKKANLAILMLARDFKVSFLDINELPLALDIHLKRVLGRSGLFFLSNDEKSNIPQIYQC